MNANDRPRDLTRKLGRFTLPGSARRRSYFVKIMSCNASICKSKSYVEGEEEKQKPYLAIDSLSDIHERISTCLRWWMLVGHDALDIQLTCGRIAMDSGDEHGGVKRA